MAKTTKGRIKYGKNAEDILKLSKKVYDKHVADGATSVLKNIEDYDWDVSGPKVAIAQGHHDDALHYKGLMEEAYRERDKYISELDGITRVSGSTLKALNSKNVKRLTDWGYEVDDTPPSKGKTPPPPSEG